MYAAANRGLMTNVILAADLLHFHDCFDPWAEEPVR